MDIFVHILSGSRNKKMNSRIFSIACSGILSAYAIVGVNSIQANALEWSEPELSSISVYSGKDRSISVTVPIGYEYSMEDVPDLNFTKTYESSATTLVTQKVEYRYDTKEVSKESIEEEYGIYGKLQDDFDIHAVYVVGINDSDKTDGVLLNFLIVKITYDVTDHSCYGDHYLQNGAVVQVQDGEYSKAYTLEDSRLVEYTGDTSNAVQITSDNYKVLLDCNTYYLTEYYSYSTHTWVTRDEIVKPDTVVSDTFGYVSNITDSDFTVTLNEGGTVTYPIDAEYVNVMADLSLDNRVSIYGHNTTTQDWYTNPYKVCVEPSYKVTLSGTVTEVTKDGVVIDTGYGITYTVKVQAKVGDAIIATNVGDAIDESWWNTANIQVISNTDTVGDSGDTPTVRGDVNGDGKVTTADLLLLKKMLLGIS